MFFLSFSVTYSIEATVDASQYILAPVELVIDVPHEVGCFEELSDISSLGEVVSEIPNIMSPIWCIKRCLSTDLKYRFACKLSLFKGYKTNI